MIFDLFKTKGIKRLNDLSKQGPKKKYRAFASKCWSKKKCFLLIDQKCGTTLGSKWISGILPT